MDYINIIILLFCERSNIRLLLSGRESDGVIYCGIYRDMM